jgi:dienelactone hydrolase
MKNERREFLKLTGLTGISLAGMGMLPAFAASANFPARKDIYFSNSGSPSGAEKKTFNEEKFSIIGLYGEWAAGLRKNELPAYSFRRNDWSNLNEWRMAARKRLLDRLSMPDIGGEVPPVKINKQYTYDGLHLEEVSWQLPYGRPTEAILIKPANHDGPLPGILAFHDHAGNKYFGSRKITRTSEPLHPLMEEHQRQYYENFAWANEIAKRGYVVLVPDAFPFASRRVMLQDVPGFMRQGLSDKDPENPENIKAYNEWASQHEHIMAKSLFSAGTSWPGVFLAEDLKALDILCARKDVDPARIGCGGLSGGGMRTVFMAGLDPRIKCAVCVGFMTTWKDFIINKSFTHTWMAFVPLIPNELDFPEILGLRAPLPALVLNDENDDLYTPGEMRQADKILGEIYKKADASNHYRCSFYPGPHKFDKKMQTEAFDWFDKWLKT